MIDQGDLIISLLKKWQDQNFIMGNEETELELSVESRSFVNQVNDQVRKRQKILSNVAGEGEELFYYLGNVYGCNDGISSIHGKEFPKQSEFHREYCRSHTEENVRHICKISGRTRLDLKCGTIRWENTHGNICH